MRNGEIDVWDEADVPWLGSGKPDKRAIRDRGATGDSTLAPFGVGTAHVAPTQTDLTASLVVGAYFAYWHDGFYLGPRFVYPLLPLLTLLASHLGDPGVGDCRIRQPGEGRVQGLDPGRAAGGGRGAARRPADNPCR